MAFEQEKDALDGVFNGLDKACRAGSFGLQDAAKLMAEVNTIGALLHGGVNEMLSRIVQPPVENQTAEEDSQATPSGDLVPGTDQRVAKSR